ncbi:MAG: hypothetical protein ACREND_12335 [Gemmatimonadaceae bacterium]
MRFLGFVCAIVLLVGCSGATSVRPFGGAYGLIDIDGQPPPQPLQPGEATLQVVGGTLSVGPDTLRVTLTLQGEDTAGRPLGAPLPLASAIPYVRHGDSLLVADSGSVGDGLGGVAPGFLPIGRVLGSSVALDLFFGLPVSTGFTGPVRRFLFAPAS